jgi:hypothetical protein
MREFDVVHAGHGDRAAEDGADHLHEAERLDRGAGEELRQPRMVRRVRQVSALASDAT